MSWNYLSLICKHFHPKWKRCIWNGNARRYLGRRTSGFFECLSIRVPVHVLFCISHVSVYAQTLSAAACESECVFIIVARICTRAHSHCVFSVPHNYTHLHTHTAHTQHMHTYKIPLSESANVLSKRFRQKNSSTLPSQALKQLNK